MIRYLIMLLLLAVPAYAQDECDNVMDPNDLPCYVTSTWNYTAPCTDHTAVVYNETGQNIINFTFSAVGESTRCRYLWNLTTLGDYYFNVDNGDYGYITVGVEDVIIELQGGFINYYLLIIWVILVYLTLTQKGQFGKTIQIFNIGQGFLGIILSIAWLSINWIFGVLLVGMSVLVFFGKMYHDR